MNRCMECGAEFETNAPGTFIAHDPDTKQTERMCKGCVDGTTEFMPWLDDDDAPEWDEDGQWIF